jgi:chemotaxis protein histidine kinase CheA
LCATEKQAEAANEPFEAQDLHGLFQKRDGTCRAEVSVAENTHEKEEEHADEEEKDEEEEEDDDEHDDDDDNDSCSSDEEAAENKEVAPAVVTEEQREGEKAAATATVEEQLQTDVERVQDTRGAMAEWFAEQSQVAVEELQQELRKALVQPQLLPMFAAWLSRCLGFLVTVVPIAADGRCCWHAMAFCAAGSPGWSADLIPLTVDILMQHPSFAPYQCLHNSTRSELIAKLSSGEEEGDHVYVSAAARLMGMNVLIYDLLEVEEDGARRLKVRPEYVDNGIFEKTDTIHIVRHEQQGHHHYSSVLPLQEVQHFTQTGETHHVNKVCTRTDSLLLKQPLDTGCSTLTSEWFGCQQVTPPTPMVSMRSTYRTRR